EILTERGVDEEYIHAIQSHGYGLCSDVKPEHVMEKVLYTIDELTGLINATAIMRPSKSVLDLELKSVKKKYKDRSFAAGVNREVIEKGAAMLGMNLDDVITETIAGMRDVADAIGLRGNL
ncbi:MAG: hydrolase, partial [Candidatus Cryosericum sp.]